VITRRRPFLRTVFVAAVAALAIGLAPDTIAQDARAAPWWRDLPWWHELQMPNGPTQTSLLQRVRATPASQFDPQLPASALDAWLRLTLAPVVEDLPLQLVNWRVTMCLDPRSAIADLGSQLCAAGTVRLSADRNVQIVILIAEGVPSATSDGAPQWVATGPFLRDLYIERVKDSRPIDSLDVPALGALSQLLNTPFEQWPTVDLETTIDWDPPAPLPGETVRFTISVRNTSNTSAVRAWITTVITPCCADAEVRHEWFPYVAAGQSVRAEVAMPLPAGWAMALVSVRPLQRDKVVRELRAGAQPAVALIGYREAK
jgi:hypothetical protein